MEIVIDYMIDSLKQAIQSPAFWVLLVFAVSDSARDNFNLLTFKWPLSGFRIMRRGLTFRRAVTKDTNAQLEVEGFKLFVTVDKWHLIKWVSIYSIGAFALWFVPTVFGKILTCGACSIGWKIVPRASHFK